MAQRELGLHLPELGDLVLHVRGELHAGVQPLAHASFLFRERPEELHVQRRRPGGAGSFGPAVGLRRRAGESQGPAARQHVDSSPAGHSRGFRAGRRHVVLFAGCRHVQGARGISRLPDAGAASWADHPLLLESERDRAGSVRRQRHDACGGEETRPAVDRIRVVGGLRGEDQVAAARHAGRRAAGRRRRSADQRPADAAHAQDAPAQSLSKTDKQRTLLDE